LKAVYTHYSKPYNSDIRNSQTHWLFPYLEFLILAYSSAKSKKFFGKTVLVTDSYGKSLIVDSLGIPFDEVIVELDDIEKHNRFWASGKIYGYTKAIKEFEPFVHFDNDAGFHVKPPEFTDDGFGAIVYIFSNALMDRAWRLQENENMSFEDRSAMVQSFGEELRKLIKIYTNVDMHDFFE